MIARQKSVRGDREKRRKEATRYGRRCLLSPGITCSFWRVKKVQGGKKSARGSGGNKKKRERWKVAHFCELCLASLTNCEAETP